jgi:hypothetical protein
MLFNSSYMRLHHNSSWWPTAYTRHKCYNAQPHTYFLNLQYINNVSTTHVNSEFSVSLHGNRGTDYIHVMTAQEIQLKTTVLMQNARDLCSTSKTNCLSTELLSFLIWISKQFPNTMMQSMKNFLVSCTMNFALYTVLICFTLLPYCKYTSVIAYPWCKLNKNIENSSC